MVLLNNIKEHLINTRNDMQVDSKSNRSLRRSFQRKYGIKVKGSNIPDINMKKKQEAEQKERRKNILKNMHLPK